MAKLPADRLRIKKYGYDLVRNFGALNSDGSIDFEKINAVLESRGRNRFDISNAVLKSWISGEKRPRDYTTLINQIFPNTDECLTPNLKNSLSIFFCAIDIFGSSIKNPIRNIEFLGAGITVRAALKAISKKWAPSTLGSGKIKLQGRFIPEIDTGVPKEIFSNVFIESSPFTILDFMLRASQYLKDISEENFRTWALDLASCTLITFSHNASLSIENQYNTGQTGVYAGLLYRIFFFETNTWPNEESIYSNLITFKEINEPLIMSQWLMRARNLLQLELSQINCTLSVAEDALNGVPDRFIMLQEPNEEDYLQIDEDIFNLDQKTSERDIHKHFEYLLKYANGEYSVSFHSSDSNETLPLMPRIDLHQNAATEFRWGYSGSGAMLLTKSILAHHFGHDNFRDWEMKYILEELIAPLPNFPVMPTYMLSTKMIDAHLNEISPLEFYKRRSQIK